MTTFKRVFLVVLDSVGIGAMPDAAEYNDTGAHTLRHIAEVMNGLSLPHLAQLGLGNIDCIPGVPKNDVPSGHYTKMAEASVGKDTMTGHWELMGLRIQQPLLTFPSGFPNPLIEQLERKTGRKIIGNRVASGTKIIEKLGEEHLRTGALIVYTSADSVLQIAAHEEVVHLEELYEICRIARSLTMVEQYRVGRVIARPFIGQPGSFTRTEHRHDYALKPIGPTVMDHLLAAHYDVIALGKITDIFAGVGISKSIRTKNNDDGVAKLLLTLDKKFTGLCFLNLVDFDSLYGHRRNPIGYGKALETFDQQLPLILDKLKTDDLLIITADHGNDPTHHGTDHTREYVPLLIHHKKIVKGHPLPIRQTFADVGATIAANFDVKKPTYGTSFLHKIIN